MNPHPGYQCLWDLSVSPTTNEFDIKLDAITNYKVPASLEVRDFTVPGLNGAPEVRARLYRDPEVNDAPLVLNIHGGGFVSGSLDRDNHRCVAYAMGIPCTVLSVEYRLAPAAVYPSQIEDCLAVLNWAYANPAKIGINRDKIALLGTSAGGAIAAGLALWIRDKGGPKIAMQMLNYSTFDYRADTTSVHQFYEGSPLVKGEGMAKVWGMYIGGFDGAPPSYYAVPALARDLAGLPPACVVTCEYDPLRDEGIDYARRLMAFAVPTELYSLPRVPHGVDLVPAPLTKWIREGMFNALRREFGML
jgi:acetyl esterase/lipase